MNVDALSVEFWPIKYELNGTNYTTTARIIHLDIPPFSVKQNEDALGDIPSCDKQLQLNNNYHEEEIYPSEKNPFADEFEDNNDSFYNEPAQEESVYVNNEPDKNPFPETEPQTSEKTDKDSGVNVEMSGKFPAFKSKNHNFNPFGSDTDQEEDDPTSTEHQRKVLEKKKSYFFNDPPSQDPNFSEPESTRSRPITQKKKYSMIEEPVYDGSIYSTCKRKAPVPPKLSDKERVILELIDLNSQLSSLEIVSQKITIQVEERESEYMEFSLENQSLIDNRNCIITKKFELYNRLAELSPFDKRVYKLKKTVSKKKNTHEPSTPAFKWRSEKERDLETQYLYEMKSSQRCYSTHLERKQINRPKLSNFLSTLSRSNSLYGSNRSLSFVSKFDSSKTNQ